ncbi:MAG: rod shape-determining protein RodA [Saprospiraceae bacterium]
MGMRDTSPSSGFRNFDRSIFGLFLALNAIGWLMVYTVGYKDGYIGGFGAFFNTPAGKQTIWMGVATLVFLIVTVIDWKFWQTFAYPIFITALVGLVLVLVVGTKINNARSWFSFGGFSIQPSELAKFGACLAMAAFLSNYSSNLKHLRSQIIALGLMIFPMTLILLQPDAGSALVFGGFLVLFYREGLSSTYYLVGAFSVTMLLLGFIYPVHAIMLGLSWVALIFLSYSLKPRWMWMTGTLALVIGGYFFYQDEEHQYFYPIVIVSAAALAGYSFLLYKDRKARLVGLINAAIIYGTFISLVANYVFNSIFKPYQQERINIWLNPSEADPQGALYNLLQSQMAIGSGGATGKGFLHGTMTKLDFVPEQYTDFIFCTIGEEQGFIGSFSVIALFLLLLLRIIKVAERQRSNFSRHYMYGVAGILFVHFFINIGMTMGLMPIIGIPLPFISKGGSSLIGFTIMIAVLLKLDGNRYKI